MALFHDSSQNAFHIAKHLSRGNSKRREADGPQMRIARRVKLRTIASRVRFKFCEVATRSSRHAAEAVTVEAANSPASISARQAIFIVTISRLAGV